jgi:nucleoside-diphosphate-sugar epimerase
MAERSNTVLVTGGRGFVGRVVGKLLQREGYAVVSLDCSSLSGESAPNSPVEVQCDIGDPAALQSVFEVHSIQTIVHLAAILPTAAQQEPLRATQINVDGSLNLLEMARQFGIRRFVFGSSVSIYGSCPMGHTVSEQDPAAPEDLYGAAKLYVEQLGQSYRDCHGLEFVSLRIVRVLGPGSHSRTSAWRSEIFELLNANEPVEISIPYAASERLLLAHVDDVAQMIVTLLRAERLEHVLYNSPCESLLVEELKSEIERLNSNIRVRLGESPVAGNPYRLNASRFEREFEFKGNTIFDWLRQSRSSNS